MSVPGPLVRLELATGLLVRSIKINGYYLFVDNCTVNPTQEIGLTHFVQGGPGAAIATIGAKHIAGEISCPVRVDRDGHLDPAIKELLSSAEKPSTALRIDTNHVLSHTGLTAEAGGTNNNRLLSLDTVVIQELRLSASPDSGLQLKVSVIGMIDSRDDSDYVAPSPGHLLGRELAWADCEAYRLEAHMRAISSIELVLKNEIEKPAFLQPIQTAANNRSDQVSLIGVKSCKWSGSYVEFLRLGADLETYIHGGWMQNENLTLEFGTIKALVKCPLFDIGQVPLNSKTLKRTTEFHAQIAPNAPLVTGALFSYSE